MKIDWPGAGQRHRTWRNGNTNFLVWLSWLRPVWCSATLVTILSRSSAAFTLHTAPHSGRKSTNQSQCNDCEILSSPRCSGKTLSAKDNAVRQQKVESNITRNVTPLRVRRHALASSFASAVSTLSHTVMDSCGLIVSMCICAG
eukprot:SAG11_NODE_14925_length_595_cov_0.562500_1_plen_143_part_10